ncbi:PAS domain-containing protein [Mucilaginibacter sp.]|jgi:PAS domain S-box-containing protein|uniref:PAS domain-containing protein n=1 Tax=Mucilaginibacter sp. TaxID=1882438 RepID=UPI0035616719
MISNKCLYKIFEALPTPSVVLLADAPKFTVVQANKAYLELANRTNEELKGRGYFEVFPEIASHGVPSLQKVISELLPYQTPTQRYELPVPGMPGYEVKYFKVLNTPVLNDDNEVECIIRSITDVTAFETTEIDLIASRNQFQSLVQTVEGIVWEVDMQNMQFTFVSDHVKNILGYTPEEWLNTPIFWEDHIHPNDREHAINYCHLETQQNRNHTFDYRMIKADGSLVWIKDLVSVISEKGKPRWLRGIMVDITLAQRLAGLDHLEKTILALNAQKDEPTKNILLAYLQGIEELYPQIQCSIMQVKNMYLQNWASPSLPETYLKSVENVPIGENAGSCGTAAFLKEQVIVSDIATDKRWADYKQLALLHGLHACWSYPILNAEGELIAVLGVYYHEEKLPQDEELKVIERAAAILKVILENRQSSDIIHENSMLMAQGQELANFGNWRWDIQHNIVSWSDSLYTIYGLSPSTFKATFEGYQELLHPDDRAVVYDHIQKVLIEKKDIVFEERIIRPNGEIRYLRSWGRLQTDEKGNAVKMIGACLDITETKLAETKLKELHQEREAHLQVLEESEKKYSNLFHLSPLPMWVYDVDSLEFLSVNNAAIKHYGYTEQEFLSMTIKDIRPEGESSKVDIAIELARKLKGFNNFGVFDHKKKNGQIIKVEVQSNYIHFNGRNTRLVLANDVTERQDHIDAIEKQNKCLQDIAWIQSHVVRAPLARIMGLIELFKHYKNADMDKRNLLDNILISANELDGIVREISDKTEEIRLRKTVNS